MRWFVVLTAAIAGERVAELVWSRAHERRMARRGGAVVREPWYGAMVALHTGTLVAAPLEAAFAPSRSPRLVRAAGLAGLAAATALRIWTLRTLGDSWSTRVTRFDGGGRRVVTRGPYRFIRHPNYLAVMLELAAFPLVGGAWRTALAATALNALVLSQRIPLEERELARDPAWRQAMLARPRFLFWARPSVA
ncbi:MAG TPA: isoprenylcysteine carboxylmethyltransferase family protein [Polyangia bacterium]|jgi:methyltransferase